MKHVKILLIGFILTAATLTCYATTLFPANVKCAVCGCESRQSEIMSTNAMGSPDLDLRPPEMERSTMPYWVQRCPECGYCNDSLEDKTSVDKEYLSSKEYTELFAKIEDDSLAASFIRQARIAEKTKDFSAAMLAYIHAAWDCDDAKNTQGAKQCRLLALKILNANYNAIVKSADADSVACLKTDLLRRASSFEEAIETAQNRLPKVKQNIIKQILAFQIEKCKAKDAKVYRIADAVTEEPEDDEPEDAEVIEDSGEIEIEVEEPMDKE